MMIKNKVGTKKIHSYIVTFILLVVVMELFSYLGIYVYDRIFSYQPIQATSEIYETQTRKIHQLLNSHGREYLFPGLGWNVVANYRSKQHKINAQGLRSDHEYSRRAQKNIIRVAAFGDSFVYGNQVSNQDAWVTVLENEFKNIEALNYGVPGYGTDQAFLRYKSEGNELSPEIILICFTPVNLRRAVNRYRRFISLKELAFFKPRFILDKNGKIKLLESPINTENDYKRLIQKPDRILEIGKHDQWYEKAIYENPFYDYSATVRLVTAVWLRIYNRYLEPDRLIKGDVFNKTSEAFKVQSQVIERFVNVVKKDGLVPVVVLLPDYDSIQDVRNGSRAIYTPLVTYLKQKNILYKDTLKAFLKQNKNEKVDAWFVRGGHYSPAGNKIVANWLGRQILSLDRSR